MATKAMILDFLEDRSQRPTAAPPVLNNINGEQDLHNLDDDDDEVQTHTIGAMGDHDFREEFREVVI